MTLNLFVKIKVDWKTRNQKRVVQSEKWNIKHPRKGE